MLLFLLQNARKCVWRPVSDRTRWGEGYTAPQTLAGFKGVEIGMGKREERREREWERERGRKEGILKSFTLAYRFQFVYEICRQGLLVSKQTR